MYTFLIYKNTHIIYIKWIKSINALHKFSRSHENIVRLIERQVIIIYQLGSSHQADQ